MTLAAAKKLALLHKGDAHAWRKADHSSYREAHSYGVLTNAVLYANKRFPSKKQKQRDVRLRQCIEDAKKYKTRQEWQNAERVSYKFAVHYGWLNACTRHMVWECEPATFERCLASAKKHKNLIEWITADSASHAVSRDYGWRDKIVKLAKLKRNPGATHFHIYNYIFKDGTAYVGATRNLKARHAHHCGDSDGIVRLQGKENLLEYKTLAENVPLADACRVEQHWIDELGKSYRMLNKAKAHSLGGGKTKYSKQSCLASTKNYTTFAQWYKREGGFVAAAYRYGWISACKRRFTHTARQKVL